MKGTGRLALLAPILFLSFSCSTTKVLQEGEYRLVRNDVEIVNDSKFSSSELEPYLRQKPNSYFILGWNPSLNIYNWQNGKGKGWDRFVTKIGTPPVVYDSTQVDNSIENVTKHLEYLGYFDSKVTGETTTVKKRAKVLYSVELGKQYPISRIEYDLPEGEFAEDFYSDTVNSTVKVGDFLSEDALNTESTRSSRYLRDKGFYSFNSTHYFYEADTLAHNDSATLRLTIRNYTRNQTENEAVPLIKSTFNDVTITYPEALKFRNKVLLKLNAITPGKTYNEKDIGNTYSRLSSLRTFSGINIGTEAVDSNLVDCTINLTPSKMQGFKINFEASINSSGLFGMSPQLSYYHKNIFRGGEWFNLSFMGNFQFMFNDSVKSNEFGVSAGLSFPKFLGLPYRYFKGASIPRTDINVSYNYQSRPEYTRNIISLSYGYSGNWGERTYYQIYPVQLGIVRLFNLDQSFYDSLLTNPFMQNAYQNHFDLGLGSTFYYTTDASVNPRTTYLYSRLQFDISGNLVSLFRPLMTKDETGAGMIWNTPFSQYVRVEWTFGRTWRFGRNDGQAFATRALAGVGYAYGNSSKLPFEKHFYAGGSNSLRGWLARTVGPGLCELDETFVIPNQSGDIKFEVNAEYRFLLFWKLEGALFVDAGNIWTFREMGTEERTSTIKPGYFFKSIAADWGAGLRFDLNFLVIRVDMGLRVHDPAREVMWLDPGDWFRRDGYAFHFGVGYPF